jgi:hypothetical protein
MRPRLAVVLGLMASAACASKDDVTPTIVISPGAKERIMVMDRLRHHGAPRRLLPKVTVEEVDDAELPSTPDETTNETSAVPSTPEIARDAGAEL